MISKAMKLRIKARELYGDENLEIDTNATISKADDGSGAWVAAWVWVASETEEK